MSFRIQSSFKQPAPKVHTDEEGNEVKVVKPSGHSIRITDTAISDWD
jgi:hypothetical protein